MTNEQTVGSDPPAGGHPLNWLLPRRPVPVWILVSVALFQPAFATLLWFVLLEPSRPVLRQIVQATHGWVQPTLVIYAVLALPMALLIVAWGRQTLTDLGMTWRSFWTGCGVTFCLWGVANLVLWAQCAVHGQTVVWASQWNELGVATVLGLFLAQFFGNALYEEIIYRRFLVAQTLARIAPSWTSGKTWWWRLAITLVVTQLLFGWVHIPHRLSHGLDPVDAVGRSTVLMFVGLFFCWVYFQTRNLWIAIGVHTLINHPMLLIQTQDSGHPLIQLLALIGVIGHGLWRYATGASKPTGTPGA